MNLDEAVGWLFIGWMLVVMVCAPLAWAWLMLAERKDRRLERAQDAAIAVVNEQKARDKHPAGTRPAQVAPDDDPRFAAYMDWWNGRGNGNV